MPSKNRHFILNQRAEKLKYSYPNGPRGSRPVIPQQDRIRHGKSLQRQIDLLKSEMGKIALAYANAGIDEDVGLIIEFESFPDIELAFESLSREKRGIELLNVRKLDNKTFATVFVPDGKLGHFENLIRDYLEEKRDRNGKVRDNRALLDTIADIRAASIHALWTDYPEKFPPTANEKISWEVWLPIRGDRLSCLQVFRQMAQGQGLEVSQGSLEFPERTVVLANGSVRDMTRSVLLLNSIAELRRAHDTSDFFDQLPLQEQTEWLQDLLDRTTFAGTDAETSYVCILDTGVNRGHAFIENALDARDLHTIEPILGVNDELGHGTEMAGITLAGNLFTVLESNDVISINHRLESVKLLNANHSNSSNSEHHGYLTIEAVARPEITSPLRQRVFCMAITARDNRDRGRPSAWSATIDKLAADADNDGITPRLFVISAGNVDDPHAWEHYPESNTTDGIHDPAQSWNGLTVGAYTELESVSEPDLISHIPIAPKGGISPFSTTSQTWERHWPLKPDVVFEGGNVANDGSSVVDMPSLSLLTTSHEPHRRSFSTIRATSGATALASRMAAQLMAAYPELWPETIRALLVHSADWTETMKNQFLNGESSKRAYERLVRHCGFGVPNLESAMWSVSNSLTLISQDTIQPFGREGSKDPTYKDMGLHHLPWPLTELEELGETQVEMRVTLSYFIEPNPSHRGVISKYRYESHGLRFDVKRATESNEDFLHRINAYAREETQTQMRSNNDPAWILGVQNRHRGSLHSDIWKGTAADLASRGVLAVYPTIGWWKTRSSLQRYEMSPRYSLLVSIRTPETDTDLYNAISNQISVSTEIESP